MRISILWVLIGILIYSDQSPVCAYPVNTRQKSKTFERILRQAKTGNPAASFRIATYFEDGIGTKRDINLAEYWYKRAGAKGYVPALTQEARLLCSRHCYKNAERLCKLAKIRGDRGSYLNTVLAWALAGQGQFAHSLDLLYESKVLAKTRRDKTICFQVEAEIYEYLGQPTKAIDSYQSALYSQADHRNADYWRERIRSLLSFDKDANKKSDFADNTPAQLKSWHPGDKLRIFFERDESDLSIYKSSIMSAFAEWANFAHVPPVELTNVRRKANVIVRFSETRSEVQTHTACKYSKNGYIEEARLNISIIDRRSEDYQKQVRLTCLHEVGHVLGILGHSGNPNDVMYDVLLYVFPTKLSVRDGNSLSIISKRTGSF